MLTTAHAACCVCRQFDGQHAPNLLHLPDDTLGPIVKLMGKRSRLLCTRTLSLYGSPGSTVSCGILSTAKPWCYPVRRLVVHDWHPAWAAALPAVREIATKAMDPIPDTPLAQLTSLQLKHAPTNPSAIPIFAPHLASLRLCEFGNENSSLSGAPLLRAVLPLRTALQRLDMGTTTALLGQPAFPAALKQLTALARFGLNITDWLEHPLKPAAARRFTQALTALTHLSDVKIEGFRTLGKSLGPALQGLGLTSLALAEYQNAYDWHGDFPPDEEPPKQRLTGCIPPICAMPGLQYLALRGELVTTSTEVWQLLFVGSASLTALDFQDVCPENLVALLGHTLGRFPALTKLGFSRRPNYDDCLCGERGAGLSQALAHATQLQQLQVWANLTTIPDLTSHTALTSLELEMGDCLGEEGLQAVGALASLKRLALRGHACDRDDGSNWGMRMMEAVKKLPLLEELELLVYCTWREEDVLGLLPPRQHLKRVGIEAGQKYCPWAPGAVQKFALYDVELVFR
jgi:hypothetical protein